MWSINLIATLSVVGVLVVLAVVGTFHSNLFADVLRLRKPVASESEWRSAWNCEARAQACPKDLIGKQGVLYLRERHKKSMIHGAADVLWGRMSHLDYRGPAEARLVVDGEDVRGGSTHGEPRFRVGPSRLQEQLEVEAKVSRRFRRAA